MNYLTIRTNSVASGLVTSNMATFSKLNHVLKQNRLGEIILLNDKARFIAGCIRTVAIPKKALKDADSLCGWLLERIKKQLSRELR